MKRSKMILSAHVKSVFIKIISVYQLILSPVLGRNCRFHPTCSEYAKDALTKKGIIKGVVLSAWRVLRCNPYCKGGFDPVK